MDDQPLLPVDPTSLAAWADELRAMAAIGLLYSPDHFDRERYARLQTIAAEMLSVATGHPAEAVEAALTQDVGYVTVKVGVAAAIFNPSGRILL
ncbi:MAG: NUDIX hydrolase N-terminal domain-containing protein, partial [Chloroflexota bacterium]